MSLHTIRLTPEAPGGSPDRSPEGSPVVAARPSSIPIVLAHGFTQNADCWGRFGHLLAADHQVSAVDLPGHGRSGHDDADLPSSATLLTEAGGRAVYVGYSMGGRVALHAALAEPAAVRGLVLIGATAGLDDPEDRANRRQADAELAARLGQIGLPRFLDRWLANPLFGGLDEQQAARTERLTNRVDGLMASLENCGTGTQVPLWDRLAELTMPVLIIAGSDDAKFSAIGRRMAEAMIGTGAEMVLIPGTHAVHLERPAETTDAIRTWLESWS